MLRDLFQCGTKKIKNKVFVIRCFPKAEDGGVFTIFVLFGFLIILSMAGIGVDLMNLERDRVNLQSTLDRAVLAAADLNQTVPPRDVVEAYLDKAGLGDKLKTLSVQEGSGSRIVSATAETVINTHFMSFSGIPQLTAKATSTAEMFISAVEISLVLDMSTSMNARSATPGKTKIQVLKEAAKEFVTSILEKRSATNISMTVVPYATQVNAGAGILDKFTNVSAEHSYSHCLNFTSSQYNSADIDPTAPFQRTAHFDPWKQYAAEQFPIFRVCPVRAGTEITAVTDDIDELHERIDTLIANGTTSIDIGVKWGAALLDPKFQGVISDLAAEGVVPAKFSTRPESYNSDVLKVIIVMTDGRNTPQYMLNPTFRSGHTEVWFNPEYNRGNGKHGEYSVRISTEPDRWAWIQHSKEAGYFVEADHPFGNPENENASNEEAGTAVRLTYPELFNLASLWWNAKNNYYWQNEHENDWYWNLRDSVGSVTKDTRTTSICDAAKNKGVIIYGIAFEAPPKGLSTIKNCASSDSHVYDVNGIDLKKAFESIASSIKKLRLTQ